MFGLHRFSHKILFNLISYYTLYACCLRRPGERERENDIVARRTAPKNKTVSNRKLDLYIVRYHMSYGPLDLCTYVGCVSFFFLVFNTSFTSKYEQVATIRIQCLSTNDTHTHKLVHFPLTRNIFQLTENRCNWNHIPFVAVTHAHFTVLGMSFALSNACGLFCVCVPKKMQFQDVKHQILLNSRKCVNNIQNLESITP